MSRQTRTGNCRGEIKQKVRDFIITNFFHLLFCLVGHTREISNYIFRDLQLLCERLDELDIEAIITADCPDMETYIVDVPLTTLLESPYLAVRRP